VAHGLLLIKSNGVGPSLASDGTGSVDPALWRHYRSSWRIRVRFLAGATSGLLLWATAGVAQTPSPPDYKGQKFNILGDTGPASSATSVTSSTGFTSLTIVPMYPVLFCGRAGGDGRNEYSVTPGAGPVRWLLEVPSPPSGAKMYDVRYEPYDNIAAINAFAKMLVEKVDDNHISITTQAYPNCDGERVRLRITVSYAK
jgi:hypothetical protein